MTFRSLGIGIVESAERSLRDGKLSTLDPSERDARKDESEGSENKSHAPSNSDSSFSFSSSTLLQLECKLGKESNLAIVRSTQLFTSDSIADEGNKLLVH